MRDIEQQFAGKWRITWMDKWAQDAVDLVGPGFVCFDGHESEMRFIVVRAWMDVYYSMRDGKPCAEFSWEGKDERDDRSGRGWCVLDGTNKLTGHFYFHMGEDSAFTAERIIN